MKLIFTYIQHKGQIIPTCHLEENHQLNPLTGYLNDPMGGLNYFSFLDHSLSILTDEMIQEADISSNSWCVEVMNDQVNFYFLFAQEEESLYLTLPRGIMIDVLRLWLIFRSQEPEEGLTQRLEF
jgi:uncharacterized protein PM0491